MPKQESRRTRYVVKMVFPQKYLKRCDLDDLVLKFCNTALQGGLSPDLWKISNIIPTPEKGI